MHSAHLEPREHDSQRVLKSGWVIEPGSTDISKHLDPFGNPVHLFRVDQHHKVLKVVLEMKVEVGGNHTSFGEDPIWQDAAREWIRSPNLLPRETWPHLIATRRTKADQTILNYTRECFSPEKGTLEGCKELMKRIHGDFKFDSDFSEVNTSIKEVFLHKKGVCQDFTHLMLAGLRGLGIPARYVSGYLETLPPPGKEKLVGVDASHAWVEVFVPSLGWVQLDPTNNIIPEDRHVVIAVGRDYDDVSPVRGVFHGASDHGLEVRVDVRGLGPD